MSFDLPPDSKKDINKIVASLNASKATLPDGIPPDVILSAPKNWSNIKNTVALTLLTSRHIQCLHLMYAEVAWVLLSSGTQVQPQVILDPDYLPDYPSVSYDYDNTNFLNTNY